MGIWLLPRFGSGLRRERTEAERRSMIGWTPEKEGDLICYEMQMTGYDSLRQSHWMNVHSRATIRAATELEGRLSDFWLISLCRLGSNTARVRLQRWARRI